MSDLDRSFEEFKAKYGDKVAILVMLCIAVKLVPIVYEALREYEQMRISKKHKPNGPQGR